MLGLGLLNVWLLRSHKETPYRGGEAKTLKNEFAIYGLANWFFYLIGALKITSAVALFLSFIYSDLSFMASSLIIILMLGAIAMHIKAKDSIKKTLPALAMFFMSGIVYIYSF